LSDVLFLKGKAKWVTTTKTNEWGKWTMVLYPNPESLELIRELQGQGVKNVIKKDEDGYYVRLSRNNEFKFNGKIKGNTPPVVFDGSRPLPDGGYAIVQGLVGNGSDVTVKMEVYSHRVPGSPGKMAKAMRWESVRVDTLVPYSKVDYDADTNKQLAGFEETPGYF
jgi:hypothetical protein